MSGGEKISVYDRRSGQLTEEIVLGEGFVRFLYENPFGRFLGKSLIKRRFFSSLVGFMQDLPISRKKIAKVASDLGIDLSEAQKDLDDFKTFNDFFIRALKKDARPVDPDPMAVISGCDSRLLAIQSVKASETVSIKGSLLNITELLQDSGLSSIFEEGAMLIYRLCPSDYHRFHFPEKGIPRAAKVIDGPLNSVSPIALRSGLRILDSNLRHITILETKRQGKICIVEVGAMCVGSIVQTYSPGVCVERGAEKGMFRFGGSTVVVLYEQGRVKIDDTILKYSSENIETLVKMGEPVGVYIN